MATTAQLLFQLLLQFEPLNLTGNIIVLTHSDASWAPKHEGFYSTAAQKIYVSDGKVHVLVHWKAKRLATVCGSSAAAEIRAAVVAMNDSKMMQVMVTEIIGKKAPLELCVDASIAMAHVKSKFELLPQDRSYVLDVRALRQLVKDQEWPAQICWVKGTCNLADTLTKPQRNSIKQALRQLGVQVIFD